MEDVFLFVLECVGYGVEGLTGLVRSLILDRRRQDEPHIPGAEAPIQERLGCLG